MRVKSETGNERKRGKTRKLTRLKTKPETVDKSRKGILRYYGTGIWEGDLKTMRRNRARSKDNL
jgi:hypothetical protein